MWDAVRSIGELRREGRLDEAAHTAEQARQRWPTSDPIRSQLAWVLYRRDLAAVEDQADAAARSRALKALQRIAQLTTGDPYNTYSALPPAVLRYATVERQNPTRILPWLEDLDPARLSTERYNDIPSPRARWYSATTRALLESRRPGDAIELCHTAIDDGCLTDREAAFIRYRIGKAQLAAGLPQQAYDTFTDLRPQLREWYLDASIGTALNDLGRTDEAIEACRAALAARGGELTSRIHALTLLTILLQARDHKLAPAHLQFVRQLRADRRWPPDRDLEHLATAMNLPSVVPHHGRRTQPPEEVANSWRSTRHQQRPTGTISVVFDHGRAGFLTTDDGRRLFFSVGQNGPTPETGLKVSFRIVAGYDRKRDQPSQRAVDLRPA